MDHNHDHSKKDDVPAIPKVGILASHGSMSVCGRRREMEDAVTVIPGLLPSSTRNSPRDHDFDFFAVFRVRPIDWENVMVSCFLKMDENVVSGKEVEDKNIKSIGSTAVVSLISKDKIIVANCGDSRAVLSRAGSPIPLSQDHKPDRPDERERIEAAGGAVINWNGSRVLGDRYLKPYVTSVPEVTITSRTESDEFVILANVACNIARRCLEGRVARGFSSPSDHASNAALAATFLTEVSMAKGGKDNISVVIVELKKLN
ncbi:hypothetical protein MKW98_009249 [Papaver atlanticum]|uniref:PPM-type phosphatase domain-containing protein n=1 Tax=Papaver atlanticum TaxID=357466 RepID=A0AAD4XQU3_9MAGN|nr:hypothetical protein MKW98_009249 [Papaver atlanticum]